MAEKMLNGHTVIAAHGSNMIIEVNEKGIETWRHPVQSVISAHHLENGNFLVELFLQGAMLSFLPLEKMNSLVDSFTQILRYLKPKKKMLF